MDQIRTSNGGDHFGLWACLIIVAMLAIIFYYSSKDFVSPTEPVSPVDVEVTELRDGQNEITTAPPTEEVSVVPWQDEHKQITPSEFICFNKSTGSILWKENLSVESGGFERRVVLPLFDQKTEQVICLAHAEDGVRCIFSFDLDEDVLFAQTEWCLSDGPFQERFKGEVLDEVNAFLFAKP